MYVGSTDGSLGGRPASGDTKNGNRPFSTFIGWTADGRLVAHIQWGANCDHPTKQGVYLIDPRTLKRTYEARGAWAMWNAFS